MNATLETGKAVEATELPDCLTIEFDSETDALNAVRRNCLPTLEVNTLVNLVILPIYNSRPF